MHNSNRQSSPRHQKKSEEANLTLREYVEYLLLRIKVLKKENNCPSRSFNLTTPLPRSNLSVIAVAN